MESWVRRVVEAIHSSRAQAVLYLAGGASQALGWLLSVPGASGTVLEVVVPYSRASMAQLLGKMPVQFTSKQAAEDMALSACNRELKISGSGSMCQCEHTVASGHHKLLCRSSLPDIFHRLFSRVYGAERKKTSFQATFFSRQLQILAKYLQPFSQTFVNLKFRKKAWNSLMKIKSSSKLLMGKLA